MALHQHSSVFTLAGDRGLPGPPGLPGRPLSSQLVEKGDIGDPGRPGFAGFTGPRGNIVLCFFQNVTGLSEGHKLTSGEF